MGQICKKPSKIRMEKPDKPFIDAQIIMANRFYDNLIKTKNGKRKIEKLGKFVKQ